MRSRKLALILSVPLLTLFVGGSALAAGSAPTKSVNRYVQTNLVSDQAGQALNMDPNLVNAWGLVAGPMTPWWVADNHTDLSTIYDGAGNNQGLVVQVAGDPTGEVFNGGSHFVVTDGSDSGPAVFLFATESGTILGWNPNVPGPPPSMMAILAADRSNVGAVYKGLAIGTTNNKDFLYATDFHNGRIDMFNGTFKLVTPEGAFQDEGIPPHFAPFGIQNIGGVLFVTYAKQDADAHDDVPGHGHGFVDMYSLNGEFMGRVAGHGSLNSPWGMTMAPAGFGRFSGDLLVGNFGNGRINVYAPGDREGGHWTRVGMLRGTDGSALTIQGLWALQFGNGGPSGPTTTLFFTAGPGGEAHGLFGKIEAGQ
jgi:uncharacterized protein (TIGR03118 family)